MPTAMQYTIAGLIILFWALTMAVGMALVTNGAAIGFAYMAGAMVALLVADQKLCK